MTIREIQLDQAAKKARTGNAKDLKAYLRVRRDWRPTLLVKRKPIKEELPIPPKIMTGF